MTSRLPQSPTQLQLPRAVLFDNDGTLIRSEALHADAWRSMLAEMGITLPPNLIPSLAGRTGPQLLRAILDHARPGWDATEYDLEALTHEKNNRYLELVSRTLVTYDGAEALLEWLQAQGVALAIVTNARARELSASLTHTGLGRFFRVRISRDDVAHPKPDPLPYTTACALLGIEPEHAWVVEDSPVGLEAGLRSGAQAIALTTNYRAQDVAEPVPGRPDLKPFWIAADVAEIMTELPGRLALRSAP